MTPAQKRAQQVQQTNSARSGAARTKERRQADLEAAIPAANAAQEVAELAAEDARLQTSSAEASAITDAPIRARRSGQ